MPDQPEEDQRRRALAWALTLTEHTRLAPSAGERALLEGYVKGRLSLAQVLAQSAPRVQHVLYRSRAVHPFTDAQLAGLLEESRAWNGAHGITGLLCYGEAGHFVQLLEGEAGEVHRLYAKIQRDPRHTQVITLSDAACAERFFPDWRMAYVAAERNEYHWVLTALEARDPRAVPSYMIHDPHLLTLLAAFTESL